MKHSILSCAAAERNRCGSHWAWRRTAGRSLKHEGHEEHEVEKKEQESYSGSSIFRVVRVLDVSIFWLCRGLRSVEPNKSLKHEGHEEHEEHEEHKGHKEHEKSKGTRTARPAPSSSRRTPGPSASSGVRETRSTHHREGVTKRKAIIFVLHVLRVSIFALLPTARPEASGEEHRVCRSCHCEIAGRAFIRLTSCPSCFNLLPRSRPHSTHRTRAAMLSRLCPPGIAWTRQPSATRAVLAPGMPR